MRFVVHNHEVFEGLHSLQHRALAGSGQVMRGLPAKKGLDGVLRSPLLVTRFIELVDVREEEVSGRVRFGRLATQDHLQGKLAAPLWGY